MSQSWNLTTPPVWAPTAVAGPAGWTNPTTGEVLIAMRNLVPKGIDAADVPAFVAALTSAAVLVTGDKLAITITASEPVKATGALAIEVMIGEEARQAVLNKTASTDTDLVFEYTIVAEDVAAAGAVVVGEAITGSGKLYDQLAGSARHLVAVENRIFAAVGASAVAIN